MAAILNVIQTIKTRTPMYIGGRSISCLRAFLNGWEFAHDGMVDDAAMMEQFQQWVARKCGVKPTQSWDRIILFDSQDEADALDKFFRWFDEFCAEHQGPSAKRRKVATPAGEPQK